MDSGIRSFPKRPEGRRPEPCGPVPCLLISGRGFPHSDIRGSKLVRSSPRLFAAYHVLHRLRVPRHPPNALKALDRSHCRCPPIRKPLFSLGSKGFEREWTASPPRRPQMDGTDFDPNDAGQARATDRKDQCHNTRTIRRSRPEPKWLKPRPANPPASLKPQGAKPRTSG